VTENQIKTFLDRTRKYNQKQNIVKNICRCSKRNSLC